MADSKEAMQVEATIIEEELSPLSRAEAWLAQASESVAERCELYRVPEEITSDRQYRDAKAARSQVRRDFSELDAERKAMTRELEDRLKRFRAEVRDVLSPLTSLDEDFKEVISAYEEAWKAAREIELAQEYEAIAPDLVPLVPFGTILRRFGSDRGRGWLNRTTNVEAAKDALADAVEAIAEGERTIDEYVPDEGDRVGVKAIYFKSLDLQAAINAAREARERRERVERLEEERRQREVERRMAREEAERRAAEEAARAEAERASRAAALEAEYAGEEGSATEGSEPPADYVPTEALPTPPEPPAAPAPVPYEKPAIIPAPPAPPADMPRHWVVDVPSATRAQMQTLADVLGSMGLRGNISAVQ